MKLPLILLPGMLCDEFYWRDQVRALSDVADCTVADFGERNSFDDMADDVLRVAAPRFALASHSMGGRVAFEIYRRAPDRVALLGLFGTAYTANGPQEASYRHVMLDTAKQHGMRGLAHEWVKRMVHPARLSDKPLVDSIVDMVDRKTFRILEGQVHASMTRRDQTALLPTVACPTLVLCGREDAARPLPAHEEMAAAIPNSTLVVIESCGHMCMLERPDEVSQAMGDWLANKIRNGIQREMTMIEDKVRAARRRFLKSAAAFATLGVSIQSVSAPALAQAVMPAGPFSIIIPTAAGGQADVVARLIGNKMSETLGRPLVIEAKAGAGGLFSGQYVAKAEPNGSTLLFVTGAHSILPGIHRATINFDAVKDFEFISTISTVSFIISTSPGFAAKTFPQLIEMSKKAPGTITYSTVGVGSTHHLIGELLQKTFGVKWTHVPYKGGATGLMDVAADRVSVAIDTPVTTLPLVQNGTLRPLAVSQEPRMPQLPQVPAVSEFSPGLNVGTYLGLAAPARTPRPIVELLNKAMVAAVADPTVQQRLAAIGSTPQSSTPDAFTQRVARDVERWTALVTELNITN